MIEFTFTHSVLGPWIAAIPLTKSMTGGQAFDAAALLYKQNVFRHYIPGHPDVTVTIKGR